MVYEDLNCILYYLENGKTCGQTFNHTKYIPFTRWWGRTFVFPLRIQYKIDLITRMYILV